MGIIHGYFVDRGWLVVVFIGGDFLFEVFYGCEGVF